MLCVRWLLHDQVVYSVRGGLLIMLFDGSLRASGFKTQNEKWSLQAHLAYRRSYQ